MRLTDSVFGNQPRIRVEYVAFDSHGVKSMCTRITTPELCLTIDPGASAEAASFPLPEEKRAELAKRYQEVCRLTCSSSTAIVISHYHLDHFLPQRSVEAYSRKTLFIKSRQDLPPSQTERAEKFLRSIDGLPTDIIEADGRRFRFKKTEISFSRPVWHGARDAEPGTVIMTEVSRGKEKVLVTSDVSGPVEEEITDLICAAKAQTVVLDGYPTAVMNRAGPDLNLVRSIINICRILSQPELVTLVIDHHLARDYRYPAFFKLAYEKAKEMKKQFGTAAELTSGRTSMVLEGLKNYGPTKWQHWSPLDRKQARKILEAAALRKPSQDYLAAFERWVG